MTCMIEARSNPKLVLPVVQEIPNRLGVTFVEP